LLKLKGSGLSQSTLEGTSYKLSYLSERCNLLKPEEVKFCIANLKVANSYKQSFVKAYAYFAAVNSIEWNRPRFKSERKMPTIPTKENIMKVISASKKYAVIFKVLMECGMMPYELSMVNRKDIDFERRLISVKGFKGHASRTLKLTQQTTGMLKLYFSKYDIFPESRWMGKLWRRTRNNIAKKLQDPSIKSIRLYDLRHYYATMLYRKTRDILLVMRNLGHKKIETTLIYTQLLPLSEEDEYTCKTATNVKEATELIESGFEYVTEMDGVELFRKRK
jgi:integrase/recombinase XerD